MRVNERGDTSADCSYKERKTDPIPTTLPPKSFHPSKYVHTVLIMAESGGDGDEKFEKLGEEGTYQLTE